jgi:uncharacterized iron-regulated membrane protein
VTAVNQAAEKEPARGTASSRPSRAAVSPSTLRQRSGSIPHDAITVDPRLSSHQPLSQALDRQRPPSRQTANFVRPHTANVAATRRRSANRRTHRQNHRPNHFNPNSLIQAPRPNPHSARGTVTHPPPRFRALALFGRRPLQRPHTLVMPATETLVWGLSVSTKESSRM